MTLNNKKTVKTNLGIIVRGFIVILINLEVTKLVGLLVRRYDAQPITEEVLLEKLLGEILEVALREGGIRRNMDCCFGRGDFDATSSEVVEFSVKTDFFNQKLFLQNGTY